jgi:transcriptional regulator with PAS, ATPase and Fis domain
LAHALHTLSRRSGPFVSITPRDFSSTELVQAELFGAVEGAYTGAVEKWGLVKRAERGTLFIDELQSIDADLQGKLITFIEDKSYRRVGEAESHRADVRFIFATNRPLENLVAEGLLRDDFAYRLERLRLTLPALSERRLDISSGICFSLAKILRERGNGSTLNRTYDEPIIEGLTNEAYARLFAAPWPGNLRQLENTIAKLIDLASIKRTSLIDESCVQEGLKGMLGQDAPNSVAVLEEASRRTLSYAQAEGFSSLQSCVEHLNEQARLISLELSGGDALAAAEILNDSSAVMTLFQQTRIPLK